MELGAAELIEQAQVDAYSDARKHHLAYYAGGGAYLRINGKEILLEFQCVEIDPG